MFPTTNAEGISRRGQDGGEKGDVTGDVMTLKTVDGRPVLHRPAALLWDSPLAADRKPESRPRQLLTDVSSFTKDGQRRRHGLDHEASFSGFREKEHVDFHLVY